MISIWKVDVGYCASPRPSNISEITITDTSSPFGIIANPDINIISQEQTDLTGLVDNYDSILFGDSLTVYAIPFKFISPLDVDLQRAYDDRNALYDGLNYFSPSSILGYPNLWAYISNQILSSNVYVAMHFKQLKKVMIFGNMYQDLCELFDIDDSGNLTYIMGNLYNFFCQRTVCSARDDLNYSAITLDVHVIKANEITLETLTSKSNKWYELSFSYRTNGQCFYQCNKYPGSGDYQQTEFFEALFSNGFVEPDYTLNGDPFEPGGTAGEGGGGGAFDNTSTPIDIPNLPSISAASTGFISLFNPSLSQLNDLASYLWSDLFEIDGWKKLFADPMDAILGLSILPVAIPSGGVREVKVGNISTGVSLTIAASQFVEVDCGSIDINEYWGAYLDYEPYTQAQIFLPYIGTRPISVDDIMGKTVRVVYHVDILTGACCCFVKCGESVLYTYNGQCSIPIPITGANYTSVVNGVISIAASVGSLVATGGASAPTAVPAIASSVVNQMKPQIEKSGSISGSAGVLNMQVPYLILIRPRQALPSKQNEFIGYPSLITVQLTELSGYTEVQSIHLENIPATQEELVEIQSLLEGGVIF